MDAAKAFWAIPCLARLGCYAVYAGWEKKKPQQIFYGYAVTVDTNGTAGTKIWVFLMRLGAIAGCHQMPERSFFFRNYQFPICARCTGLFLGDLAAIVSFSMFIKINLPALILFFVSSVILLGVDGYFQLKDIWVSTNFRRLVTGLLCGFFVTGFLIRIAATIIL